MYSINKIIEVFNRVVEDYDKWYQQPMGRYVYKAELKALKYLLPKNGVGIDYGGGTGIFSKGLLDEKYVICIDPSINMVKKAVGRGVDSILGVMSLPPIRKKSIDFVFMITVLEFLVDPLNDLMALKNVLKKDSVIIVMIINRESSWGKLYMDLAENGEPVLSMARFYNVSETVEILERAGYSCEKIIGVLDNPPTIIPEGEPRIFEKNYEECGAIFIKAKLSE